MKNNMENNFNKGIEEIKKLQLSPEDKQAVLARLVTYTNEHPAQPIKSPYQHFFYSRFAYAVAGALLMLLITGSSVTLAAEGSLPGDLLYPVKIYVTEPVHTALLTTEVQKAQWAGEQVVRRLDEAEVLSTQGRLSTTTMQTLKDHVEKSTNEFHAIVQSSEEYASSTEMESLDKDFDHEVDTRAHVLESKKESGEREHEDNRED